MSFANAAKAAKAVAERAAPLAGTAAVFAMQPPAQAREIQGAGPSSAISRVQRIQDEFELVDFEGSKPVFSKPIFSDDEIASAAQAFRALVSSDDEPGTDSSDGAAADAVIEAPPPFGLPSAGAPRPAFVDMGARELRQEEMRAALQIANRVLRHPGVQREIAAAALADPEVLAVLGARPDLDGYLVEQGFAARGLLTGADGAAEPRIVEEDAPGAAPAGPTPARRPRAGAAAARQIRVDLDSRDPLVAMLDGVVKGLEWTGARISEFGSWLRDRLSPPAPKAEANAAADGAPAPAARGEAGAEGLLKRAGQVAVLLVMIMILGRAGVRLRGV
ncbi:MAG: hypothetical protein J3K34DRAFT_402797 [Monoraphidium minutum]|nr:MAG: hypothetical protein J3K34DRAFT_402797 [Monoraphidium minutum]